MLKLFSILILSFSFWSTTLHAETIAVAAASNLRFMLPELVEQFEQQVPEHHLNVSYAASGTLSSQIQHGAPFDVFLSASPEYIERLQQLDKVNGKPINYAQAQLALFSRNDSKLELSTDLSGLKTALESNTLNKLVIANPMHAPYGKLAKQQLQQHGLWQAVQSHLLIAENASQALQFSLSPQASAGFIPYSYVVQSKILAKGHSLRLDAMLQQQAVMIKQQQPKSDAFIDFLGSEQAKAILIKHGFKVMP